MNLYSRRTFLASLAAMAAPSGKRPNILYIMSDDHASQAIGCYGSGLNRTPNIDRIGNGGMRFTHCFCTNSLCTPSRAVILTGKYSHNNGIYTLDDRFPPDQVTFSTPIQRAGYYTALIGKLHVGDHPTGFDYWNILPGQGKYFDPDTIEMGKRTTNKGYVTDVLTEMAMDTLQRRPKDKPFCLLLHHKAPHDPWLYDQKHAGLYQNTSIAEPPTLNDDYRTRGQAIRMSRAKIGMEQTEFPKETASLPPERRKSAQYEMFIKSYLRCIASIDDNAGRVLDYIDQQGLTEDTIVVYTSDQGVFVGEHGLFDKRFMYEDSLRMPLLVRYPHGVKAGSVNDDFVLNLDFPETLLDYAGASIPADMQGRSIRPLLEGHTPRDWRRSMYYRYWMHRAHFDIPAHYGIRTKDYKLIYYYGQACGMKGAIDKPTKPEWELFDLREDPNELNNVYGVSAYQPVVRQLKIELKELRSQYGDTSVCGAF